MAPGLDSCPPAKVLLICMILAWADQSWNARSNYCFLISCVYTTVMIVHNILWQIEYALTAWSDKGRTADYVLWLIEHIPYATHSGKGVYIYISVYFYNALRAKIAASATLKAI